MSKTLSRRGIIALVIIIGTLLSLYVLRQDAAAPAVQPQNNNGVNQPAPQAQTPVFNKQLYPLDQAGSPWYVVNKSRALPKGYIPSDLMVPNVKLRLGRTAEQMQMSKPGAEALEKLFAAASKDELQLMLASGYRSEAYQTQLYNGYVAKDGQAAADRYSARPGTSEHQTGLAVDVGTTTGKCELEICFGDTPEGKWVLAHAHEYGFIIRYLNGKEDVTGYQYEPWHLRYVGTELSAELYKSGLTMEEFFGLPAHKS